MTSKYPTYTTKNGTPIKAYVAEAIGVLFSVDGGENNFRGKSGVIGSYLTGEEAIQAARNEKTETCAVQVTNTRDDHAIIFTMS